MNRRWWALLYVEIFGLLSGCVPHTISGSYLARGQDFVEMIQITQSTDGQLLGTLSHAGLKANGTLEQNSNNITGATDGHSLTLVAKSQMPMAPAVNLSGTVDGGEIKLTVVTGSERFNKIDPSAYQTAVEQLTAQGAAIQQRQNYEIAQANLAKHLREQNAAVDDLNKRLIAYAAKVQSPKAIQETSAIYETHKNSLARAKRGLEKEQSYPRGSYQAGQVSYAISQVAYGLDNYDYQINGLPDQGRRHINAYDTEIAKNPCQQTPDPALTHCEEQQAAIQVYQAARPVVLNRMDDIAAALKNDKAAMKSIVDQADAYSK